MHFPCLLNTTIIVNVRSISGGAETCKFICPKTVYIKTRIKNTPVILFTLTRFPFPFLFSGIFRAGGCEVILLFCFSQNIIVKSGKKEIRMWKCMRGWVPTHGIFGF